MPRPKRLILSPKIIHNRLSREVIGQEEAKKTVSNAVFIHLLKTYQRLAFDQEYGNKSNVLLLGPSGCGKTHLIKTLERIIPEVPVLHIDCTGLTKSGFTGNSLEDYLDAWFNSNGAIVESGIVFMDEIDKLCYRVSSSSSEDWSKTIQQNILKIVEGHTIQGTRGNIHTEGMLFIFGGNFQELREKLKVKGKKRTIGFGAQEPEVPTHKLLHQELIKVGLIQELTGRIANMVEIYPLERKDLKKIFLNKEAGPYYQYQEIFASVGSELELSDYYINKILDECCENKTGARGLQTALDRILQDKIFNLPEVDFTE